MKTKLTLMIMLFLFVQNTSVKGEIVYNDCIQYQIDFNQFDIVEGDLSLRFMISINNQRLFYQTIKIVSNSLHYPYYSIKLCKKKRRTAEVCLYKYEEYLFSPDSPYLYRKLNCKQIPFKFDSDFTTLLKVGDQTVSVLSNIEKGRFFFFIFGKSSFEYTQSQSPPEFE
jgi:hypothetical protein